VSSVVGLRRGEVDHDEAAVFNTGMANTRTNKDETEPARWYRGADVPMRVIRRFARQVAERFRPDKIILFGSYAYGTPHQDSDVDILVVMPARNQIDQSVRIELACDPPFPLDIIVRTPKNMKWRLEEGDSFLTEITSKGKVLYEKNDAGMGAKRRGRLSRGEATRSRQRHLP
jgi:predicted nucleotidyltransferase